MLGKLIKHEWKGIYKVGCIMLLSAFLMTVIGYFSMRIPAEIGQSNTMFGPTVMVAVLGFMVFVFGLVGISYGIIIYLGVRFYRSMYADEGYLAHTLPVTSYQLLFSKVLVGGIWLMFTFLVIMLGIFVMLTSFMGMLFGEKYTFMELIREMEIAMNDEAMNGFGAYLIYLFITLIIGPFVSVASLFGSVTLGQLFGKHRGIMAIICYIAVKFGIGILSMLISIPFIMGTTVQEEMYGVSASIGSSMPQYYVTFIITLIVGIVLFFVACHIDSKKLNLE